MNKQAKKQPIICARIYINNSIMVILPKIQNGIDTAGFKWEPDILPNTYISGDKIIDTIIQAASKF